VTLEAELKAEVRELCVSVTLASDSETEHNLMWEVYHALGRALHARRYSLEGAGETKVGPLVKRPFPTTATKPSTLRR
jgi:hypothetical protein